MMQIRSSAFIVIGLSNQPNNFYSRLSKGYENLFIFKLGSFGEKHTKIEAISKLLAGTLRSKSFNSKVLTQNF